MHRVSFTLLQSASQVVRDPNRVLRPLQIASLIVPVGNLAFPDWRESFGWEAVGRRVDEVSGRDITTVFYRNPEGIRLGYAVVAGAALGDDPPGREITRDGKTYNLARNGDRTIVTWTQQGHTCAIVAPSAVPGGRLVDLAASRNV